jgi:ABC-type nitrate/sulfonate/bicarbonate transport system substrate-binding protein
MAFFKSRITTTYNSYVFISKALKSRKLKLSDFDFVLRSNSQIKNDFISGKFQIALIYDPESLEALKEGGGKILSSTKKFSSSIPEGWNYVCSFRG